MCGAVCDIICMCVWLFVIMDVCVYSFCVIVDVCVIGCDSGCICV